MGHLVGKDLYRKLGAKVDGLTVRVPWNDALYAVLQELYSEEDAELVVKMPWGLSKLHRLERTTGFSRTELERRLESLCNRGLVMDLFVDGAYHYMPSPLVIGIFEFTMMRTGGGTDSATWAKLFKTYLEEGDFYAANFADGQKISLMRAVPHDGSIPAEEYVEVLDYEKATNIVESADRMAIGICSCRHERHHNGDKECKAPLDTCSTFGATTVDFMVRNGFARESSKSEMLENIARSREMGLVLNADNVQRNVSFMCHCCSDCCNVLRGVTSHGYPNTVVTSNYIAAYDRDTCKGCGVCSKRCPVDAIGRAEDPDPRFRKHGAPKIDDSICIGCGVCTVKCKSGSMKLHQREQRVLHPESTFERVILQCLERGTLQNQLFDDPSSKTHAFMRACVGGFLRLPPVKRTLMSDVLRSRFLTALKNAATQQGKSSHGM